MRSFKKLKFVFLLFLCFSLSTLFLLLPSASRVGEVLEGRYEVVCPMGRGVFSSVVRATDRKSRPDEPSEVAIKIIRSNETM